MSRYVLSVVGADGNPQVVKRFGSVGRALQWRDTLRGDASRSEHWMVHDSEDEERGYLDWPEDE